MRRCLSIVSPIAYKSPRLMSLTRPTHSALDLPPIHTRPPAEILLSTLGSLALKSLAFDSSSAYPAPISAIDDTSPDPDPNSAGTAGYLTSIISSPLNWVPSESLREQIWEAASMRLSERAGRTGMLHLQPPHYILIPDIGFH